MRQDSFVRMSVGELTLDPITKTPIVILRDSDNKLNLPIWIGLPEATAMATELEGIQMGRPMTHDLLRRVIESLGGEVVRIEVTELRDNTYYAVIRIRATGGELEIDARPSDAIALALRTKSPIFVADQVLESSAALTSTQSPRETNLSNLSPDKWAEILEKMGPDDFKYRM